MALPASFLRDGFLPLPQVRKRPRLMIGTDGRTNTGKTEFILSAPGPGIVLCVDRGYDSMLDNPDPPPTRRGDFAFKVVPFAGSTQSNRPAFYQEYWIAFLKVYLAAIANPDARTVALDGDADSWELQRLAEHGKLTGVYPATEYKDVYAARRVMINRAWESGKIIIATNRVSDEWKVLRKPNGDVILDENGKEKKDKTGKDVRKGFPDQDYLWQLQITHLYRPPGISAVTKRPYARSWGLRITKCKVNTLHQGTELWGADCNFQGLVSLVYPGISLKEWGY